eukprot:Phypoly_transcript_04791.p1 GENE.Phypoly_transcript_04791~~Phypoly_transcript_04791.p1  ORF type:complete len:620 (+),score=115.73 Phypoly_transcript_04791:183-2042(+)
MASHSDSKDPPKLQELNDIAKAIDLLCLLNINDLRSALRTLEGGALGVFLGDSNNKQAINIEKVASSLPRHLLAHIVMGDRNFTLTHPGMAANGWLAYTAKGLHLINCFVSLEWSYPRLAAVQRGLEHRSCILDLLLLAGAVWNTELAGATTFPHYVLCAEGIRLTSAALSAALQHDLDRGAESNKPKPTDSSSSSSTTTPSPSSPPVHSDTPSNNGNHSASNGNPSSSNLPDSSALPYSYEWYDALIIHPKIYTFTSLPVDTISLLQQVTSKALLASPDHVPKLCRSFHTQLEAFYLMCCSEEFVGQLLLHPVFVKGELLAILQQALHLWNRPWTAASKQALTASGGIAVASAANAFHPNEPIASVVTQILRVLYVLFEKENPCFLDAVAASATAFQHMQAIITTVTQMSSRILDIDECWGPNVLESFKLIEILSDDSNFKNQVIARVTPLLFQLLSLPPATLSTLFTVTPTPHTHQQLRRDFMIVVFRVVGNLHCFNEALCKPEDKGLFLRTTATEMTKHSLNSNPESKNLEIRPANVLTNLNFLLHRLITDRQVYHLNTEELDLVTSFTESLQHSLSLPNSSTSSLAASSSSLLSSSSSDSTVTHKRKHPETLEVQ